MAAITASRSTGAARTCWRGKSRTRRRLAQRAHRASVEHLPHARHVADGRQGGAQAIRLLGKHVDEGIENRLHTPTVRHCLEPSAAARRAMMPGSEDRDQPAAAPGTDRSKERRQDPRPAMSIHWGSAGTFRLRDLDTSPPSPAAGWPSCIATGPMGRSRWG